MRFVMNSRPVLESRDLVKTFTDGKLQVDVLKGVTLQVQHGERIAVVGSSGSGKSARASARRCTIPRL